MAIGATFGPGNWVRLHGDDYPGDLYVRMERDDRGRWRVHDLLLRGEWRPIIDADLREMALYKIEEWLQADGDMIEMHGFESPQLDAFFASFGAAAQPHSEGERVPRLERPTDGLTDDFLRHVASAYRQAVVEGKKPAPELARQVGEHCSPRTIHKWVYIARQRGLMPPSGRRHDG